MPRHKKCGICRNDVGTRDKYVKGAKIYPKNRQFTPSNSIILVYYLVHSQICFIRRYFELKIEKSVENKSSNCNFSKFSYILKMIFIRNCH
jgi:hypothetical protein